LIAHELTHVLQQAGHDFSDERLTVSSPSDPYEQQADRVAATIDHAGSNGLRHSKQSPIAPLSHPRGAVVIQRQIPTGIAISGLKTFGHSDLKDEDDKKKFLTNIGAVALMQLSPAGDYTAGQKRGDCTKEFITELSNTCPAPAKPFCQGDRCFEVGRNANTGDPRTGNTFSEGPDTFVDRHIARYDTSFLAGSGKNKCSVVCHQIYKYRTEPDRQYHDLGAFYIIRNFRADKFTPQGAAAPLDITTGSIQKISAPSQAPSKDDFARKTAPGLVQSGSLLDAPSVSTTASPAQNQSTVRPVDGNK
jgi:hypothetical protein